VNTLADLKNALTFAAELNSETRQNKLSEIYKISDYDVFYKFLRSFSEIDSPS
jgi:hypothetical protein